MKYLNYSDRKCASLVCRRWLDASSSPFFSKQDLVAFHKINLEDGQIPLTTIITNNQPFHHFKFSEVKLGFEVKHFWSKMGPFICSLTFTKCDMDRKYLSYVLSLCPNLEELELDCCSDVLVFGEGKLDETLFSKCLPGIKKLKIIANSYLSYALFDRFISMAPNLEMLALTFYKNSLQAYPHNFNVQTFQENEPTFDQIVQSLTHRQNSLRFLYFNHKTTFKHFINDIGLKSLITLPQLNLKELSIIDCNHRNFRTILPVAKYQKNLKVLKVSVNNIIGSDKFLLEMCEHLDLTDFRINRLDIISNLAISHVSNLERLETLEITDCVRITTRGIANALCKKENKLMKHLNLDRLKLNEQTVIKLSEYLPNLIYLNLSNCQDAVTDISIQAIIQRLTQLKVFKAVDCKVTDVGLTGLNFKSVEAKISKSRKRKKDTGINMDDINPEDKASLYEICKAEGNIEGRSLARLKGLRELDLSSNFSISEISFEFAFKFLELKKLTLQRCPLINDKCLKFIGEQNPSLEEIDLTGCLNITDKGLLSLLRPLQRVKILKLKNCIRLTSNCNRIIKENCKILNSFKLICDFKPNLS